MSEKTVCGRGFEAEKDADVSDRLWLVAEPFWPFVLSAVIAPILLPCWIAARAVQITCLTSTSPLCTRYIKALYISTKALMLQASLFLG